MSKYFCWLLVIGWVLGIAYFSGQSSSKQDLRPFIEAHPAVVKVVREMPHVSFYYADRLVDNYKDPVQFIQMFIRKLVHFTIYGCLGILLLLATGGLKRLTPGRWILIGLLLLGVAAVDEFNQFLTPSRTGCIEDVIVDVSAYVLFGLVFVGTCQSSYAK
ncbi:MAG: VanZ family protein [Syntrophomonas sp.]